MGKEYRAVHLGAYLGVYLGITALTSSALFTCLRASGARMRWKRRSLGREQWMTDELITPAHMRTRRARARRRLTHARGIEGVRAQDGKGSGHSLRART